MPNGKVPWKVVLAVSSTGGTTEIERRQREHRLSIHTVLSQAENYFSAHKSNEYKLL